MCDWHAQGYSFFVFKPKMVTLGSSSTENKFITAVCFPEARGWGLRLLWPDRWLGGWAGWKHLGGLTLKTLNASKPKCAFSKCEFRNKTWFVCDVSVSTLGQNDTPKDML